MFATLWGELTQVSEGLVRAPEFQGFHFGPFLTIVRWSAAILQLIKQTII